MSSTQTHMTCGSLALKGNGTRHLTLIEGERRTHGAPARFSTRLLLACIICLAIAVMGISCALDGIHASRVAARLDAAPKEEVYVVTGDTMWQIAQTHSVDGVSTSELVAWMRSANNLQSSGLEPGQVLVVPSA